MRWRLCIYSVPIPAHQSDLLSVTGCLGGQLDCFAVVLFCSVPELYTDSCLLDLLGMKVVQAVIFLTNAWSCFDSGETLSEVVVDSVVEYLRQPTIRSIVE